MKIMSSLYFYLFCLIGISQTPGSQEKIKTLLDTYFLEDREIIHVQFNKNIYFNNEDIAFKGYVFSKNNNTPFINTTNIQLTIYSEKEEIVKKQLLFTTNGMFSGVIRLNKSFKTGKYLFHFHTNWMNNFTEDDSFSQKVDIYDTNEPFNFNTKRPNIKTATVCFFPEGGAIIDAISNTVGVKITDCNNRGLELNNVLILDSKSNEVAHFNTNTMGNGIAYFPAEITEKYTLKIQSNNLTIIQDLPVVQETGIAVGYNNNLPNNKLAISIKTNEKGVALNQTKKLNLLVQQNGYSLLKEVNFDNKQKEQVVFIDKKHLQNGVNSIRLIDENLNEITERLIYNYATSPTQVLISAKVIANDSIVVSGTTNLTKAKLSTSILPEKTITVDKKRCILGTYYLNTYLEKPEIDNFTYFDPENKNSKRDMDYLMLNQTRSKVLWENIKLNPPIINFKFTKGVTISGNINRKTNSNTTRTVSIVSMKNNVFEKVMVDKDNTFKLENFFVQDSTVLLLQLENEKNATLFSKIVAKVNNNQTKFNLPLAFTKKICPIEKNSGDSLVVLISKMNKNIIALDEVIIKQKKEQVFEHNFVTNRAISVNSRAFKIDDRDFGSILNFIGSNGFTTGVNNYNEPFIINNRSLGGIGSPQVFLDDVLLQDFNILFDLDIDTVDEIFIDKVGIGGFGNNYGTIAVFLKKGKEMSTYISKCSTMIAIGGFSKNIAFKNSNFNNPIEFNAFGTLNWSPKIQLKENQNFDIKFPSNNQDTIQVLIEGFTEDGQLISEIKKIPVEKL